MEPFFRPATIQDSIEITRIVNESYRNNGGWTTESHLLSGSRIAEQGVHDVLSLNQPIPQIIVATINNQVIGTLQLQVENSISVIFGLFAIKQSLQSNGVGRKLINHGFDVCIQHGFKIAVVYVINLRHDLISWYIKLGFKLIQGEINVIPELNQLKKIEEDIVFQRFEKVLEK